MTAKMNKRLNFKVLVAVTIFTVFPLSVKAQTTEKPRNAEHGAYECISMGCSGASEADKKKVEEMKTNNPSCSKCHGMEDPYKDSSRGSIINSPRGSIMNPSRDSIINPSRGSISIPSNGSLNLPSNGGR